MKTVHAKLVIVMLFCTATFGTVSNYHIPKLLTHNHTFTYLAIIGTLGYTLIKKLSISLLCTNAQPSALNFVKNKTIFAFDLHGVVVSFDYKHAIPKLLKLLTHPVLSIKIAHTPELIYEVLYHAYHRQVPEAHIKELTHQYPFLQPFYDTIIEITNIQKPIEKTVELIQWLKGQGIKCYLFSNIGETMYSRFEPHYPKLFALFDGVLITYAYDNWVQKPAPAAYQKFIDAFGVSATDIIFIDDEQINTTAAHKLGMQTIHFTSSDSLEAIYLLIKPAA